jgi:beta-lactamase class A
MFAVGILLVVLVATYGLYIPSLKRSQVSDMRAQYPLLNPALALLGKENMIVDFQTLRDSLTNTYQTRDDYLVSIYFEYLPTGANISINKDEKVWPASLIKIPVAMAAMKKVEEKKWKLDNELVIMDEDKDTEYGELYKQPTGTTLTIENFLKESLINSDNTAHFVLLRNLEGEELEHVYTHLGLDDIIDALKKAPKKEAQEDNRITAKRYTIFFRSLYNATFLTPEYSQMFLGILEHAPKELLSKGIPDDVTFVHKTGIRVDEAVRADAGIVYVPGRPYLITVMIQKKDKKHFNEEEVSVLFKNISEEIYTYVTKPR